MGKYRMLEEIAVIMISSDDSGDNMKKAYEMGAFDYISRPFDPLVVRHRISNTMLLYTKQNRLEDLVIDQIYEKQKNSKLMISILSHIVEFRNGESGRHVTSVESITELILNQLVKTTGQYNLSFSDISLISTASALHDIGKISVPDEILNKPGKLTDKEFEIMKTHTIAGSQMLLGLPAKEREHRLVKTAHEICRWHHERYDGRGYPDGLKGEEIPISAQVVAVADVYDALTSERCYKKAYSHETAVDMILKGECGSFNPLLMDCLKHVGDKIAKVKSDGDEEEDEFKILRDAHDILSRYKLTQLPSIDHFVFEQQKNAFYYEASDNILFSYNINTGIFMLNSHGAQALGLSKSVLSPKKDEDFIKLFSPEELKDILHRLEKSSCDSPNINMDITLLLNGEKVRYSCRIKTMWTAEHSSKRMGFAGILRKCEI